MRLLLKGEQYTLYCIQLIVPLGPQLIGASSSSATYANFATSSYVYGGEMFIINWKEIK
jgi:hypothetical protein